uniref:Jacalin-type lectin domain-containing protein n=1 Tax=Oryza punctata TaxID=4537 RepID=A0A0E0KES5_ORYPU
MAATNLINLRVVGVQAGSVAKIGPWGGDYGGRDHDVTVAPWRLRSVSLRHGKIIDSIAFTYDDGDGALHSVGPWGGDGAKLPEAVAKKLAAGERPPGATVAEFTFEADERVTEVHGTVGPFGDRDSLVTSIKLVTNRRTIGPFGYGAGTPFSVPVLGGGGVVGFFALAGAYVESIGVYINPSIPSEN